MEELRFSGSAKITIHFNSILMWQKYRKYVLKTGWDFDSPNHPYTAHLEMNFENTADVMHICKQIVFLLQLGFEVYSCKWSLNPEYVEKMMGKGSEVSDELSDREFLDLWDGYQYYEKIPIGKIETSNG